jgi:hypothetical protein
MNEVILLSGSGLAALPGPCEGPYGTRRTFKVGMPWPVKLEVPDAVQDKFIRWQLRADPGVQELVSAYKNAGASYLIPEEGLRSCCYEVLKTKYRDPVTGLWEISGWGHTCSGFWNCFSSYVEALRRDRVRGRIDLPSMITVPSPEEQRCIKQQLIQAKSLAEAYSRCDAADIIPPPEILRKLETILRRTPAADFYEALKMLSVVIQPPVHQPPVHHVPIPEPEKSNAILYAAIGAAAYLLTK